jgi:hypothetical protein
VSARLDLRDACLVAADRRDREKALAKALKRQPKRRRPSPLTLMWRKLGQVVSG